MFSIRSRTVRAWGPDPSRSASARSVHSLGGIRWRPKLLRGVDHQQGRRPSGVFRYTLPCASLTGNIDFPSSGGIHRLYQRMNVLKELCPRESSGISEPGCSGIPRRVFRDRARPLKETVGQGTDWGRNARRAQSSTIISMIIFLRALDFSESTGYVAIHISHLRVILFPKNVPRRHRLPMQQGICMHSMRKH